MVVLVEEFMKHFKTGAVVAGGLFGHDIFSKGHLVLIERVFGQLGIPVEDRLAIIIGFEGAHGILVNRGLDLGRHLVDGFKVGVGEQW